MFLARQLERRVLSQVLLTALLIGGVLTQYAVSESPSPRNRTISVGAAKIDITPQIPVRIVDNSLSAKLSFGRAEAVDPAVEDCIVDTVRELLPVAFQ